MKHYQKNHKDMSLRDCLALDRTKLANERTYLAYIRTFISLLAAGVGFIRFIDIDIVTYVGIGLCLVSPLFFVAGAYKYFLMKREIRRVERGIT